MSATIKTFKNYFSILKITNKKLIFIYIIIKKLLYDFLQLFKRKRMFKSLVLYSLKSVQYRNYLFFMKLLKFQETHHA